MKKILVDKNGKPIKPYKPRTPFSSRNAYSNRRREEEAQRLKQESINNGTWDEEAYKKAKSVGYVIMFIIAVIILYFKISDINNGNF